MHAPHFVNNLKVWCFVANEAFIFKVQEPHVKYILALLTVTIIKKFTLGKSAYKKLLIFFKEKESRIMPHFEF